MFLFTYKIFVLFELCSSVDPVRGEAMVKTREDPMKDWTEERKMYEAEKLAQTIELGIR